MLRLGEMSSSPSSVAAWLKRPWMRFEMRGQNRFSLVRGMERLRIMLHVCCLLEGKRRILNGIDLSMLGGVGAVGQLACDKATDLYHVPGDTRARAHVFKVGERGRRADLGNVDSWSGRGKRSRNTKQDEACDAADHGSWTRDQVR